MSAPVLELRELRVSLGRGGPPVLDGVSLTVERGQIVGVVGESGAGKSVTGAAVTGLLSPPLVRAGGEVRFCGERIDSLPERALRRLRGAGIGTILQDPLTALNPIYTVGRQLTETVATHRPGSAQALRAEAVRLLSDVGIPAPAERLGSYPHEFSGGMRQRVVIALALAGRPKLLIADEPTTALDVSIQAQVLALLRDLVRRLGVGIMLITHDMGVIAEAADRVAVLYAGRVAEEGPTAAVLLRPRHPYTRGLVNSIPEIGSALRRLPQIPGSMPGVADRGVGCAFAPRCGLVHARCAETPPPRPCGEGTTVACWAAHAA